MNASSVPVQNKCDDSCSCIDGEVICEKKICPVSHIPDGMVCTEFYLDDECCPSHECVKEEDVDMESGSQVMTTTMTSEEESAEVEVTEASIEITEAPVETTEAIIEINNL